MAGYPHLGMRTKSVVGVVGAVMAFMAVLVWFVWPRRSEDQPLRLKVVRQAMVNGTPVVVFQIKDRGWRALQINAAQLIRGDLGVVSFVPHATAWSPTEPWPIQKSSTDRNEFSVLAPTNAPVWQLALLIGMESPKLSFSQKLHQKAVLWNIFRKQGSSIYNAARMSWSMFAVGDQAVLTSELITNGMPTR
jgi:hypothetical protein